VHFRIDYRNADGYIAYYHPDFFVKKDNKTIYVIEIKGREDLDALEKMERLELWCKDATEQSNKTYIPLYVKQEEWDEYTPGSFEELVKGFGD
jgi:type III restriction enzyme